MKEYLKYIRVSKEEKNFVLVIQLDGRGEAVYFEKEEDSIDIACKLRRFADRLEKWVEDRQCKEKETMVIDKKGDLLPCPICGSKNIEDWGIVKITCFDEVSGSKEFFVGCSQCGCRLGTIGGKQEAYDRWNKRAA